MVITKVFNNNAVIAKDTENREIVLMGCGIAFKKKNGDEVDKHLIEKTFILKEKDASEKFKLLLEDIPMEHISLCYDIIVTLTDHISYTIKLYKEGIFRPNVLIWEVKKFYSKEYNIGLKALDFIEDELGCRLPSDEAGNIALHLITAQVNNKYNKVEDIYDITKKIQDILSIVKYTYNIELNDNSLNYERFVTHLRFFFKRLKDRELAEDKDDFLLKQVKNKYKNAYNCMLKIEKYLNVELTDEEKLYLTLHIQRVTQR